MLQIQLYVLLMMGGGTTQIFAMHGPTNLKIIPLSSVIITYTASLTAPTPHVYFSLSLCLSLSLLLKGLKIAHILPALFRKLHLIHL
jgi:hypothetical protein